MLAALRREKPQAPMTDGCAPDVFAEQVRQYLATAEEQKATAATRLDGRPRRPSKKRRRVARRDNRGGARVRGRARAVRGVRDARAAGRSPIVEAAASRRRREPLRPRRGGREPVVAMPEPAYEPRREIVEPRCRARARGVCRRVPRSSWPTNPPASRCRSCCSSSSDDGQAQGRRTARSSRISRRPLAPSPRGRTGRRARAGRRPRSGGRARGRPRLRRAVSWTRWPRRRSTSCRARRRRSRSPTASRPRRPCPSSRCMRSRAWTASRASWPRARRARTRAWTTWPACSPPRRRRRRCDPSPRLEPAAQEFASLFAEPAASRATEPRRSKCPASTRACSPSPAAPLAAFRSRRFGTRARARAAIPEPVLETAPEPVFETAPEPVVAVAPEPLLAEFEVPEPEPVLAAASETELEPVVEDGPMAFEPVVFEPVAEEPVAAAAAPALDEEILARRGCLRLHGSRAGPAPAEPSRFSFTFVDGFGDALSDFEVPSVAAMAADLGVGEQPPLDPYAVPRARPRPSATPSTNRRRHPSSTRKRCRSSATRRARSSLDALVIEEFERGFQARRAKKRRRRRRTPAPRRWRRRRAPEPSRSSGPCRTSGACSTPSRPDLPRSRTRKAPKPARRPAPASGSSLTDLLAWALGLGSGRSKDRPLHHITPLSTHGTDRRWRHARREWRSPGGP